MSGSHAVVMPPAAGVVVTFVQDFADEEGIGPTVSHRSHRDLGCQSTEHTRNVITTVGVTVIGTPRES